jgi:transcriptional regulator with XRE-family HTH domain
MPSFRISITPSRRVAARFITGVRRKILQALEEENKKRGLKQTDLARAINVHRSVINRELRGKKDITLGRAAELAWALGRVPVFELPELVYRDGSNLPPPEKPSAPVPSGAPKPGTDLRDDGKSILDGIRQAKAAPVPVA